MRTPKRYYVQWYEDACCHIRHGTVFHALAEAEACLAYLRALPAGEVYKITIKREYK